MQIDLETLRVYYKDQLLQFNEDYKIIDSQIVFLKPFITNHLRAKWEIVNTGIIYE